MSLLPIFFDLDDVYNDPWHWGPRSRHQHFGLGISPSELHQLLVLPAHLQRQALDARKRKSDKEEGQGQMTTIGKDGFQVCMDVGHFQPNEISVKTIDNSVVIEGKHEERQDEHGFISRQFTRRYALPKGYDANSVTSTLSTDGVLTVKAPKPQAIEGSNERVVQIQQTGPAHLSVKENKSEDQPNGEQKSE